MSKKVLITGASSGIGLATANLFIKEGHTVVGLDINPISPSSYLRFNPKYVHYQADVSQIDTLPTFTSDFDIVINNAGTVDESKVFSTNVEGYINIAKKYCYQPNLKCLINVNSISGHTGLDELRNSSSQGARLALTKHLAITLGKLYGTRVVGISPGAVKTNLEPSLYKNEEAMKLVANENLLKRWSTPLDIANWIAFVALVDTSMTGQNIVVDNGEMANYDFVEVRD